MNSEDLKKRTKRFVLDVIKFFQILPKTDEVKIIGRQLLRSASSTGSNYRAACRARSDAEFYAKICIVVEEIDESLFWLEIIEESGINNGDMLFSLKKEAEELVKIFAVSRKTAKARINR